jgi:hypothetical protein
VVYRQKACQDGLANLFSFTIFASIAFLIIYLGNEIK